MYSVGRFAALFCLGWTAMGCRFDESGFAFNDAGGQGSDAAEADGAVGPDAAEVDAPPGTPDATPDAPVPDAAPDATPDAEVPDAEVPDAGCKGWDLGVVSPNVHPCDIPTPIGSWTISGGNFEIHTDNVTIRNTAFGSAQAIPAATAVVSQTNGPDILVVSVDAFTVDSGFTTINVNAIGSRALLIASFGDVTLDGNLSADAAGATSGAGGDHALACGSTGRGPNGAVQTVDGHNVGTGAGGGAYGSDGGGGAKCDDASGPNPAVGGGTSHGNTSIVPLRGGCRGGTGGNSGGNPGGAGGAIEILSGGTIFVQRELSARGGGGRGATGANGGGGGAGAGGAIRLVAVTAIDIDGDITCNGGGGGEASRESWGDGDNGDDGHTADESAAAGGSGSTWGGNGGPGATRTAAAGNGTQGTSDADGDQYAGGGGGGGGTGRIHFDAPSIIRAGGSIVSPAPQ